LSVRPGGLSDELYTQTDFGTLQRYNEGRKTWDMLWPGRPDDDLRECALKHVNKYCGGLAWDASGEALHALDPGGGGTLIRWTEEDGAIEEDLSPHPDDSVPMAIATTEFDATVIRVSGLRLASVQVRREGLWTPLGDEEVFATQTAYVISSYEEGFLFSGTFGYLTQYTPAGLCPSQDGVFTGASVGYLAAIRDGVVLGPGWARSLAPDPTALTRIAVARAVD
jgi:hypothetical protein